MAEAETLPTLLTLIKERFSDFTDVQKLAIPKILSGSHILILSPTGSGKTEAAMLPVLERIKRKKDGIKALYITPLRALNRDMLERFQWWCDRLGITYALRHGDTPQCERTKQRRSPPQIMITTPETLQILLVARIMRQHLRNVEFVIIDEIHDILDNKRGAQLSMALERLSEIATFQRIALSATLADEEEAAKLIFGSRSYDIVEVGRGRKMDISILSPQASKNKWKIDEHAFGMLAAIKEIVKKEKTLIFANTRSSAEFLASNLRKMHSEVEIHHGSLSKEVRIKVEEDFKTGRTNGLVATSSLELGIDIGDVNTVVQYGSPHQVFRLIQRVGRSGHAIEKTPHGIVIAGDLDDYCEAEAIKRLAERHIIERKRMEKGALDVIAHQLIGIAKEHGGRTSLKEAHALLNRSEAYGITINKLREICRQLEAEHLIFFDEMNDENDGKIRLKRKGDDFYYANVSTIPKEKKYAVRDSVANRIIASLDERFVANLESGTTFSLKGRPWRVVDIADEVLVEPGSPLELTIPRWSGEDIAVEFEVAQEAGRIRREKRKVEPLPDDRTVVVEIVNETVIIHACFGSRINETFARIISDKFSRLAGEPLRVVSDPYRIMIKLPYPFEQRHILHSLAIENIRSELERSLEHSFLLRYKFTQIGRAFGMIREDATVGYRLIEALRATVIYEEALRSIFFRYFDVEGAEAILQKIKDGEIRVVVDRREKLSYFARLGVDRVSSGAEDFAPKTEMIKAFKEMLLKKNVNLVCLYCGATRIMTIANAPERFICHRCKNESMAVKGSEKEGLASLSYSAAILRAYGKKGLIALSVFGVGPQTADRILRKLHKTEDALYLDLLEAQKQFIKNKKFWEIG